MKKILTALAVVAVGWWWHRRKMRTFGSIIDANVRQIAAQKQEIARALGISESTVRVVRSRIKGREK